MAGQGKSRESRIAIVGAGPAGLSAGYFLKKKGYKNVTIFERLGRVGGMCCSITEDGESFDIGANYVTPSYREVMKLAREYDADMYVERPEGCVQFDENSTGDPKEVPIIKAVMAGTPWYTFFFAAFKYLWLRWRLSSIIDPAGLKNISKHPELCISFEEWLKQHNLLCLKKTFEVPITVMGYGYLDEIAAPYALKYMDVPTFWFMARRALPVIGELVPWPKRFIKGFQRLWQKVAWDLNVRTNTNITSIHRSDEGVEIKFEYEEQILSTTRVKKREMKFDYVIIACRLDLDVLEKFMPDLHENERKIWKKIQTNSYCLASFNVRNFSPREPITCTIPLTPFGTPWAATKQFPDSDMVQFYVRAKSEPSDEDVEKEITEKVQEFVAKWKDAKIDENKWITYDRWPYFQHVCADDMKDGFYDELEGLQGERRTFYTGAAMNFELVEKVVEYSKALVKREF